MKVISSWLIAGLGTLAMTTGTAQGQVTFDVFNNWVECIARGSAGNISSGQFAPVFNAPFQIQAVSGGSMAEAVGTFISSPGYALIRVDLDLIRSSTLNHNAQNIAVISFTLAEAMPFKLTGQFVYLGSEASHYGVYLNVGAPPALYGGVANMSSSGTATVGSLPLGSGGPTTGILGAQCCITLVLESFVQATSGGSGASATGFVQIELGELPCPEDLNDDTVVNVTDLLAMLAAWGPNPGHPADLTGPGDVPDGNVTVLDLLAMLAAWGPCP